MISENVKNILSTLPQGVLLEAAAKTRTSHEVDQAISAGISIIGENYLQEAEQVIPAVKGRVPVHFIGHLQTRKVKKALELFDMIETVDSIKLAREINKRAAAIDRPMPVLIEINSGREPQKYGVLPEDAEEFLMSFEQMPFVKVQGLMTMGPFTEDTEKARPYFTETARLFKLFSKKNIPWITMRYLSMGMSGTYSVAVEEGANIVRIGTRIFGPRT